MGYAVGPACYRDTSEAAAAFCASVAGPSAGGVVSCEGAIVTGQSVSWVMHLDSAAGRQSRQVVTALPPCEPMDWEYWQPVVGIWFLSLVLILCVRLVFRPLNRETL
jgi:hypothetical protein